MKTYVVKDIIHNTQTGETSTYYTGKDGYVHDEPEFADGYKLTKAAQKKIDREKAWYVRWQKAKVINENSIIESDKWVHTYSIVEKEESK